MNCCRFSIEDIEEEEGQIVQQHQDEGQGSDTSSQSSTSSQVTVSKIFKTMKSTLLSWLNQITVRQTIMSPPPPTVQP
jgi:hypothetical protein